MLGPFRGVEGLFSLILSNAFGTGGIHWFTCIYIIHSLCTIIGIRNLECNSLRLPDICGPDICGPSLELANVLGLSLSLGPRLKPKQA
jgi:hypothetical protein